MRQFERNHRGAVEWIGMVLVNGEVCRQGIISAHHGLDDCRSGVSFQVRRPVDIALDLRSDRAAVRRAPEIALCLDDLIRRVLNSRGVADERIVDDLNRDSSIPPHLDRRQVVFESIEHHRGRRIL